MKPLVLMALFATGCVTGFHEMRRTLPTNESRAFDSCYTFVSARACPARGPDGLGVHESVCMGSVAEQYTGLPNVGARRAYLVEAGCPSPVVDGALAAR
jgi:cytochrome c5